MSAMTRAVGQSGRRYIVERILQEKPRPDGHGRVYLASSGRQKYVLKTVPREDFAYFQDMYRDVRRSAYLRAAEDSMPEHGMFAYKYMRGHLLSLVRRKDVEVGLPAMRRILRDALRGVAALHERGIVHTDIKADNVLVEWEEGGEEEGGEGIQVREVQIADLEDAAYVPDDRVIVGRQVGNWMWRSPEAHAASNVQKPHDIFSFGIVCIYAITKQLLFAVDEETLPEGVDKLAIVIKRQLSYFSDYESFQGLMRYLGEEKSPWVHIFMVTLDAFTEESPRQPFSGWLNLDPDFKDVVGKMTTVDPARRITAREALEHKWFADVP